MHAAIHRASIMIPFIPYSDLAALYRLEKLPQSTPPEPPASRASRAESPDSLNVLQLLTPARPRVNVDADSKRSFTNDRRPETPVSTFAQSFIQTIWRFAVGAGSEASIGAIWSGC